MLTVRPMIDADAGEVLAIYQAGIDTGQATFETSAPSWEEFDARRLPAHRFVAIDGPLDGPLDGPRDGPRDGQLDGRLDGHGTVLGWVAVSAISSRPVYAGVVEHGIYIAAAARGQGVGTALLGALIASTEAAGIWTIQSAIFPENTASLALHQKAGFRVVGTRERIARHNGQWRDTILLERRSGITGTA